LLERFRETGVPVVSLDEPWPTSKVLQVAAKGAHKSAREHAAFAREEVADFVESGFFVCLPLARLLELRESGMLTDLRLSPMAMKEERDRRPRMLGDHLDSGVNASTLPCEYPEAMQFGRTLQRLLYRIHHANPAFGPVYLLKVDISDGFYRLRLRPSDAAKLALIMPPYDGEPQLVAVPLACTMGWTNSPPSFCVLSETIADVTNDRLYRHHYLTAHYRRRPRAPGRPSYA
jgi:hypothetical protein